MKKKEGKKKRKIRQKVVGRTVRGVTIFKLSGYH